MREKQQQHSRKCSACRNRLRLCLMFLFDYLQQQIRPMLHVLMDCNINRIEWKIYCIIICSPMEETYFLGSAIISMVELLPFFLMYMYGAAASSFFIPCSHYLDILLFHVKARCFISSPPL